MRVSLADGVKRFKSTAMNLDNSTFTFLMILPNSMSLRNTLNISDSYFLICGVGLK